MSEICLKIQFQLKSYNSYMGKVKSGKEKELVICYNQYFLFKKKKVISLLPTKVAFNIYTTINSFYYFLKIIPLLEKNVSCHINCRY